MPRKESRIPSPPSHAGSPKSQYPRKTVIPGTANLKKSRSTPENGRACSQKFIVPGGAKTTANSIPESAETDGCHKPSVIPSEEVVHTSSSSRPHPHFIAAHLGTPCTLGALDHHLNCGHKVSTKRLESCARNCKHSASDFLNSRNDDRVFVCMACIVNETKSRHHAKIVSFREELKTIASVSGKHIPEEEITRRQEVIEIGWHQLDLAEIRDKMNRGKLTRPFYVEPGYEGAVEGMCREHDRMKAKGRSPNFPKAGGGEMATLSLDARHNLLISVEKSQSRSSSSSKSG